MEVGPRDTIGIFNFWLVLPSKSRSLGYIKETCCLHDSILPSRARDLGKERPQSFLGGK